MRQVFLTVDLGFGDAGKGSIVDCLTRTYAAHTVVRYNGGAQAGHRVVTDGTTPQDHVFAQFGSGTLAGAATHLSRYMLLEPLAMMAEEQHLRALGVHDAFQRTTIDARALVITPFQRAANRLRELARGNQRHGSCGMGIGETMTDALTYGEKVVRVGDLTNPDRLYTKLAFLRKVNLAKLPMQCRALAQDASVVAELELLTDPSWADWLMAAYQAFAAQAQIVTGGYLGDLLAQPGTVIFEGAQGVLLDEWAGFHPYTTWSTTTLANAHTLLAEVDYTDKVTQIGITRAYATRHGAGPFVSEDTALTQALPDACNSFGAWQQGFRVGWLDLVMLRYALQAVGPLDYLAVTCLDRLAALPSLQVCRQYAHAAGLVEHIRPSPTPHDLAYQAQLTHTLTYCQPRLEPVTDPMALLNLITVELGLPVGLISTGPTARNKQFWPGQSPIKIGV
jgi:adenylosuccinate synthase